MKYVILPFVLLFYVQGANCNTLFKLDIMEIINNSTRNNLLSHLCRETLVLYIENLGKTTESWSWQMLDATSKVPTGLLSLNFGELGEFRQCLSTKSKDGFIKGRYCLGILPFQISSGISKNDITGFPKRMQNVNGSSYVSGDVGVTWAICLPSKCSDKDMGIILNQLGFNVINCQTEEDLKKPLTTGATVTMLSPPYFAAILVTANLLKYMGSGPVWSKINPFEENCQKYWWAALLYIQNYVNPIFLCVPQSWYLCVDMQLYIIMPLFLLPLWKYPKVGISLTILAIIVSILVPFCITFIDEIVVPWGGIDDYSQTPTYADYLTVYYDNTYMRATPYFIGVLIGYVLVNIKPNEEYINIGFSKWLIMLLWALCTVIGLACLMGGYNYLKSETFNKWENSFYLALRRPLWTLCLAWITFACVKGNGGVINWLLSFPIYQVLNKFTYSMYLLHFQLLIVFAYSMKTGVYFDGLRFAYDFCGIIMLSFGVSIIWVMAFESPVFIIEKAIFDISRKKKSFQAKNENDV